MKTFFRSFFVASVMATAIMACSKTEEQGTDKPQTEGIEGSAPLVYLKGLGSTETTITFSVTAAGADKVAYLLCDGSDVSADVILAEGVEIAGDGSSVVVENLQSSTEYHVAAAAVNEAGTDVAGPITITTKSLVGDAEANINIVSSKEGRWYSNYNYYVTLVADNGDSIILDFYTIADAQGMYLPYGEYTVGTTDDPWVLFNETSGYVPAGHDPDGGGYSFTEGKVTVGVKGGQYDLAFILTCDIDGVSTTFKGNYNGTLSGASLPSGDVTDSLLELLEVGTDLFSFRINAEQGQYWRCSVVEKSVYNLQSPNPGEWVLNYGFLFDGPMTIEWKNGEDFIPGYPMTVSANTDYIVLAVLVDAETGYDMQSGVEMLEIRTDEVQQGEGVVEVKIKEVGMYDVTFDCIMGEGVTKYWVTVYREEIVEEARAKWDTFGMFSSFEEMMYLLITTGSEPYAKTFTQSAEVTFGELWAHERHQVCVMVEDSYGGRSLVLSEVFETL